MRQCCSGNTVAVERQGQNDEQLVQALWLVGPLEHTLGQRWDEPMRLFHGYTMWWTSMGRKSAMGRGLLPHAGQNEKGRVERRK